MFRPSLTAITQFALLSSARGFTATPKTSMSRQIPQVATFATRSAEAPVASPRVASDELVDLINAQVSKELTASQLYLSASIWCESIDLAGMASYMRSESNEERDHAIGFLDYVKKRDFAIQLEALEAPKTGWKSVQDLWESLLEAEQDNTQSLLELADVAQDCSDHATTAFLLPYHTVSTPLLRLLAS